MYHPTKHTSIFCWILSGAMFLISFTDLQAQDVASANESDENFILTYANAGAGVVFDERYEGVEGRPTVFEGFLPGYITTRDEKEIISLDGINLNTYDQVIWFQMNNLPFSTIPIEPISEIGVMTKDKVRLFRIYPKSEVEGSKNDDFKIYELLHDGHFTLLKAHDKKFFKAEFTGAYTSDRRKDEFTERPKWFLQDENGEFQKIKLGSSSIQKVLPSMKDKIRDLAKKEGWKLTEESEVVQLLSQLENN